MNLIKIAFIKKENVPIDDLAGYYISDYLHGLYFNGQIYDRYSLGKEGDNYFAVVTSIEVDSLAEKFANKATNECNVQLEFDIGYEVLGTSEYADDTCGCESASEYTLLYSYIHDGSPIRCIDCWRPVPLYKLPHIFEQEDHRIEVDWARNYKATEQLWENGLNKRYNRKQMTDPMSALSKQGKEICREFEKASCKPFYYCLADPDALRNNNSFKRCPECGGDWREHTFGTEKNATIYFCDRCRLAKGR